MPFRQLGIYSRVSLIWKCLRTSLWSALKSKKNLLPFKISIMANTPCIKCLLLELCNIGAIGNDCHITLDIYASKNLDLECHTASNLPSSTSDKSQRFPNFCLSNTFFVLLAIGGHQSIHCQNIVLQFKVHSSNIVLWLSTHPSFWLREVLQEVLSTKKVSIKFMFYFLFFLYQVE